MTDVDPEHRRSRFAWQTQTEPTTTPAGTHDHRIKNTPMAMAFVGIVLLFLVNVGLVGYVMLARETRDEQGRQTNQRINDAICDLLDQLPEGGLLDRPRQKYGCGPGIPLDQLPPEDAARVREQRTVPVPVPTPAPPLTQEQPPPDTADRSRERPPLPGGAAEQPVEPVPTPEPSPAPSEPPLIDLGPVGDLLCDNRLVCA